MKKMIIGLFISFTSILLTSSVLKAEEYKASDYISARVYGNNVANIDSYFYFDRDGDTLWLKTKNPENTSKNKIDIDAELSSNNYNIEILMKNEKELTIILPGVNVNQKNLNIYLDGKKESTPTGTYREMFIKSNNIEVYRNRILYQAPVYKATKQFMLGIELYKKPAISGKDLIVNNVSKPYTQNEILKISELTAKDDYDGDMTKKIKIIRNEWLGNEQKIGIYEQEYSVTNSAGLTTNYILKIKNQDFDAPKIEGPKSEVISYTKKITREEIKNKFKVTDNIDDKLNIEIQSDNFVNNKLGKYTFNLIAKDLSGNMTVHKYDLEIIDDVKPIFTDENNGIVQINHTEKITNELLLFGLSASDEIDGNLTKSIKIVDNQVKEQLGIYKVKYQVKDKSLNTSYYERTYEVVSTDAPSFWVSKNLISIEDVNKMTLDQLAQLIASYENIELSSYNVLINEYQGNESISGEYLIKMEIIDNNGEEHIIDRKIRVFNKKEIESNSKNLNITYIILGISIIALGTTFVYVFIKKKRK
ncbi:hypothetical protein [Haploplasma axanthum]|uniref:Ig-like domain-containing protein n=1 Tax=Haploplasma axanthum TaxID=29552 RepID=A0A449BDT7_HAPAX|nr:hypothetical protein [Haploplasma axanthum]VEU80470.1 Uncharacterised protein [Haploplasma axanthum]